MCLCVCVYVFNAFMPLFPHHSVYHFFKFFFRLFLLAFEYGFLSFSVLLTLPKKHITNKIMHAVTNIYLYVDAYIQAIAHITANQQADNGIYTDESRTKSFFVWLFLFTFSRDNWIFIFVEENYVLLSTPDTPSNSLWLFLWLTVKFILAKEKKTNERKISNCFPNVMSNNNK